MVRTTNASRFKEPVAATPDQEMADAEMAEISPPRGSSPPPSSSRELRPRQREGKAPMIEDDHDDSNDEDSAPRKKYIHVHQFKNTNLHGAWFNDPSKSGKKQRLFFGSHQTAYLAARAQDRAALKYLPFALDPTSIQLNFKEEDYVLDEKLRDMLTCEEFGSLLRKESRPKYTKMEPTPCLRHFLNQERERGNLPEDTKAEYTKTLSEYLMDVLHKRAVVHDDEESNEQKGSSEARVRALVADLVSSFPSATRRAETDREASTNDDSDDGNSDEEELVPSATWNGQQGTPSSGRRELSDQHKRRPANWSSRHSPEAKSPSPKLGREGLGSAVGFNWGLRRPRLQYKQHELDLKNKPSGSARKETHGNTHPTAPDLLETHGFPTSEDLEYRCKIEFKGAKVAGSRRAMEICEEEEEEGELAACIAESLRRIEEDEDDDEEKDEEEDEEEDEEDDEE